MPIGVYLLRRRKPLEAIEQVIVAIVVEQAAMPAIMPPRHVPHSTTAPGTCRNWSHNDRFVTYPFLGIMVKLANRE